MLIARYLGRPELGLVNGLTYRLKSNVKDNYIVKKITPML